MSAYTRCSAMRCFEILIQHVKNTTKTARKQASTQGVIGRPRALANLVYDPDATHLHSEVFSVK